VRTDLASTLVREGEFTAPAPGLTVYAQSIDNQGLIRNLFIHQEKGGGDATTYTADEGRLAQRGGRPVLIMRHGSNQEFSRAGVLNYLTFDEYIFDLSALTRTNELVHYKPSDRYLHELLFPDLQQDWERRNRLGLLAEGHARLATPLYNLALMSLALAAIVGAGYSRTGYGRRIAIASAAAAVSRILGFVVQAAAEENAWLNVLQYAIPVATMALALRVVFRPKVSRFIDVRRRPTRLAAGAA
jgi:lipopolysaccharide export system permease protein